MTPPLLAAEYVKDFTLHLRFADGTEGDVDLSRELNGEIFEPLKQVDYFRNFTLDPEIRTVTWPNGADFAPEFLYDLVKVPA